MYVIKSASKPLPILVLLGALGSVVSGFAFVTSRDEAFLGIMTAGWLLAMAALIFDYFKARKVLRHR